MTKPRSIKDVYYLHQVKTGELWVLGPQSKPRPAENLTDAIEVPAVPQTARVLAFPWNVSLIVDLYEKVLDGELDTVEVGSPLLADDGCDLPAQLLWAASRDRHLPASAGGWHRYGALDHQTYLLANAQPAKLAAMFEQHFLKQPLSFVAGLSPMACAGVIGLLRDPRWYVTQDNPSGNAHLRSFLYLRHGEQRAAGKRPPWKHGAARCRAVLASWGGDREPPAGWQDDPRCFLWRVWDKSGRDNHGLMRASHKFVDFLRQVWLSHLYGSAELFIPEYFFEHKQEAVAYRQHMGAS